MRGNDGVVVIPGVIGDPWPLDSRVRGNDGVVVIPDVIGDPCSRGFPVAAQQGGQFFAHHLPHGIDHRTLLDKRNQRVIDQGLVTDMGLNRTAYRGAVKSTAPRPTCTPTPGACKALTRMAMCEVVVGGFALFFVADYSMRIGARGLKGMDSRVRGNDGFRAGMTDWRHPRR